MTKIHRRLVALPALLVAFGCQSATDRQYDDAQVHEFSRRICKGHHSEALVLGHHPATRVDDGHARAKWRLAPPSFYLPRGGTFKGAELSIPSNPEQNRYIYPFELVHEGRRIRLDYCECLYPDRSSTPDNNPDTSSLERRYIEELKVSNDWRGLALQLGDLRSCEAIAFFFAEMARADPGRIGLPPRSEAEKREFRRREGDVSEGCVFALITMMERMGEHEFLQLVISILGDRLRAPEIRAMVAYSLADCPPEYVELVRSALLGCKEDADPLVRRAVKAALAEIETPKEK